MASLAPKEAMGKEQIIPNCGMHAQIYATHEQIRALVAMSVIEYDPEYGPGARVYRPVRELTDAARIREWLS